MKRILSGICIFAFIAGFVTNGLASEVNIPQSQKEQSLKTIAVIGSSVAAGWVTNFESKHDMKNGWGYRLGRHLLPGGYKVVNISRPGDKTDAVLKRMDKDLIPLAAEFAVIGLSLENEGIRGTLGMEPEAVFEKYKDNMFKIIEKCKANNIKPVVGLCYPCDRYREQDYAYIKRMNLLLNSLDVPSINFLGALDEGSGHFPEGFTYDEDHPDNRGHEEMYYAVVPSLFAALEKGKAIPQMFASEDFVTIERTAHSSPLSFIPEDVIHSFAEGFKFRLAFGGAIADILSGDHFSAVEVTSDGRLKYGSSQGGDLFSNTKVTDTEWHSLVVSHRYLQGDTLFFLDGRFIGKVMEQLEPRRFILGGAGGGAEMKPPKKADYKDWFIFRAALNPDEVSALYEGKTLQASLEVYTPLNAVEFKKGETVKNLAQSLARIIAYPTGDENELALIEEKIQAAGQARNNELVVIEKQPIAVNPEIYDAYIGEYEIAPGDAIMISKEDDRLFFIDRGQKMELLPESETIYFIKYPLMDIGVTFVKDDRNAIVQLVFQVGERKVEAKRIK
jgi:lysophospholipase L1-like esterase